MNTYILRDIPPDLWRAVKIKAVTTGESIKSIILRLLAEWAKGE